jgi:hypothetical protein
MTVKITAANGGSDSLDFGCAQTAIVATVTGTEVSSGEGKLELKTTTGGTSAAKLTIAANGTVTLATPLPLASGGTGTTSLSPKVGIITRDQTGADGAVAYTGVGFQPSAVHFVASIDNQTGRSIGFDNGTLAYVSAEATNGTNRYRTDKSIVLLDNNSWEQGASITALGSDGFTLTWAKGGSPPSGTMQIFYTAFR